MKFYGKAPVRISLCNGGDTDYYIEILKWTNLINATLSSLGYSCQIQERKQDFIDYIYINTFMNKKIKKRFQNIEDDKEFQLITETIKEVNPFFRGTIFVCSNVPEKSGLGGSSSLIVSLIKALIKTTGKRITPEQIAWLAYKIERINLRIKGGYQDQWSAAFSGGVNYLEFRKRNIFLEPLWLSENLMKQLEKNLVLFFIEPRKGDSGNIHKEMESKIKHKNKVDLQTLMKRRENVTTTREALLRGDIHKFADLLNKEHENKLRLVKDLLTKKMNKIYSEALGRGAIAGKVSGAGSGGCSFFIYNKPNKEKFIRHMSDFGCMPLKVKFQRLNSMGEI